MTGCKINFTKGEWNIDWEIDHSNPYGLILIKTEETAICGVHIYGKEEYKANARLIASAPDLLKSLIGLCADVEKLDLGFKPYYALNSIKKALGQKVD